MSTAVKPLTNTRPTDLPAWRALESHHQQIGNVHLRQLFADREVGDVGRYPVAPLFSAHVGCHSNVSVSVPTSDCRRTTKIRFPRSAA